MTYNISKTKYLLNKSVATLIVSLFLFLPHMYAIAASATSVTTHPASSISNNVAALNGYVSGDELHSNVWFKYGTSQYDLRHSTQQIGVRNNKPFYIFVNDLEENKRYYYQAVAISGNSITSGSILSLTTNLVDNSDNIETSHNNDPYTQPVIYPIRSASPITLTHLPQSVTQTSANLKALALPGSSVSTTGWFEWGTTTSLGKETMHKNIGSSSSIDFYERISELSPNTTYYYRAITQNQNGISKGNILNFRTLAQVTPTTTSPQKNTAPANTPAPEHKTEIKTSSVDKQEAAVEKSEKRFLPDSLIEWLILIILLLLIALLSDYLYGSHQKRKAANSINT